MIRVFESSSFLLVEVVVEELLPVCPTAILPTRVVRKIFALERRRRVPRRTPSSPPTSRLPPPALGPITVICIQVRIIKVWRMQIFVKNQKATLVVSSSRRSKYITRVPLRIHLSSSIDNDCWLFGWKLLIYSKGDSFGNRIRKRAFAYHSFRRCYRKSSQGSSRG